MRQVPEHRGHALVAVAGPDAVVIRGPQLHPEGHSHRSEFEVTEGEVVDISLTWYPSHRDVPPPIDIDRAIERTTTWWTEWAADGQVSGNYAELVERSLLVLRALTHEDTGGIAASATTSLPEEWGGIRNWDYRFVWLRDASATLEVLLSRGFRSEALTWRTWLLRAIAGDPADIQIMYGLAGERELTETTIDSLPGYEGASPVRRGNGAFKQYQGDIFGELMLGLQKAREIGVREGRFSWPLQFEILKYVEENWKRPDHGIWEIRGPVRHFTHSRAMLWAALDCGVRAVREYGLSGPDDRWEALRDRDQGTKRNQGFRCATAAAYTQYYGSLPGWTHRCCSWHKSAT